MSGHVRGWNVGAYVYCYVGADGKDHVRITLTGGSGHASKEKSLGDYTSDDLE
jgi:hypothetical protein